MPISKALVDSHGPEGNAIGLVESKLVPLNKIRRFSKHLSHHRTVCHEKYGIMARIKLFQGYVHGYLH